jgi:hypothetical protein
MALAYDAARVTRDVDAMFKPHGIVHEEAMRVATDLGLPAGGCTSRQAPTSPARYISGKEDADKRRVFDHPGLRVMAASPRHIFAMKALAARTRDIDDLRLLADIVAVESADAALQICANFYPDEPVSPRSAPCSANYSADHSRFGHLPAPVLPQADPGGSEHNQQRLFIAAGGSAPITASGHRNTAPTGTESGRRAPRGSSKLTGMGFRPITWRVLLPVAVRDGRLVPRVQAMRTRLGSGWCAS